MITAIISSRVCQLCALLILFSFCKGSGQSRLINPSFEDEPADATTPQGWHPCDEWTTPDIFPGFWGVYNEPSHGRTYVGIITRENSTYEQFGQRFSEPLQKGKCYQTAIDLAHSIIYSGYNKPIKVRIYLGTNRCEKDQLIFESPEIKSMNWETFPIQFVPSQVYNYIIIEAYFSDEPFSHKGNILLDNIRQIRPCGNA